MLSRQCRFVKNSISTTIAFWRQCDCKRCSKRLPQFGWIVSMLAGFTTIRTWEWRARTIYFRWRLNELHRSIGGSHRGCRSWNLACVEQCLFRPIITDPGSNLFCDSTLWRLVYEIATRFHNLSSIYSNVCVLWNYLWGHKLRIKFNVFTFRMM